MEKRRRGDSLINSRLMIQLVLIQATLAQQVRELTEREAIVQRQTEVSNNWIQLIKKC